MHASLGFPSCAQSNKQEVRAAHLPNPGSGIIPLALRSSSKWSSHSDFGHEWIMHASLGFPSCAQSNKQEVRAAHLPNPGSGIIPLALRCEHSDFGHFWIMHVSLGV